jgi:hypothetical protein
MQDKFSLSEKVLLKKVLDDESKNRTGETAEKAQQIENWLAADNGIH